MMGNLYFYTTLLSGVITLTLAALLSGLRIRVTEGLQKYNRARWCLAGAFAVFGLLSLMEISLGGTTSEGAGYLTGCLVIFIGSLMAMFFTMTVLSFIHPQFVHRKQILQQLAVFVPCGLLLIILRLHASRALFNICFVVMLVAYLLLMTFYTRLFVKCYREFRTQMLAFYEEEDLVGQLHWIDGTFWLSLSVGISSLLLLSGNLITNIALTIVYTLCFLLTLLFFLNYRPYATMVDRAVKEKSVDTAPSSVLGWGDKYLEDKQLANAINSWVEKKGYLDNTQSVKEIANEMGYYYPAIKDYIQTTTGEDFRSWRIRLRIQEAMRLMDKQPDILISDLAFMTGFNDRAFFYRSFQKITGKSVREYRDSLRNAH